MNVNAAILELAKDMKDSRDTTQTTIRCALNEMMGDKEYDQDRAIKRVKKLIWEYRRLVLPNVNDW